MILTPRETPKRPPKPLQDGFRSDLENKSWKNTENDANRAQLGTPRRPPERPQTQPESMLNFICVGAPFWDPLGSQKAPQDKPVLPCEREARHHIDFDNHILISTTCDNVVKMRRRASSEKSFLHWILRKTWDCCFFLGPKIDTKNVYNRP